MHNLVRPRFESRRHAGQLLAEKLSGRKFSNAIIQAIPRGGIPVAREIASALEIPYEIVFSKRIRHPADGDRSIGAVSLDEVILHDSTQFIPQSYLLNQIALLKRSLQEQFRQYYGGRTRRSIKGATVILTDDVLRDVDELTSCLAAVDKQEPDRIVVAAPVMSLRIINFLEERQIEFYYLFCESAQQSRAYTYFGEIGEAETLSIFS